VIAHRVDLGRQIDPVQSSAPHWSAICRLCADGESWSIAFEMGMPEFTTMAVQTETSEATGTSASSAVPADRVASAADLGNKAGLAAIEFDVRVVGLMEDDLWYARALELNLLGYGESFAEALDDLKGAIDAQVCYAARHGSLSTICWSANRRYFDLYEDGVARMPRRKLRVSLRKPEVLMQGAREKSEHPNEFISEISEIAYKEQDCHQDRAG